MAECAPGYHRDPTFDRAYGLELREKRGCGICMRRRTLADTSGLCGAVRCSVGKVFPDCRSHKKGFSVDVGVG